MPEAASNPAKAKFAVKTALSLTLAYMLPMVLGWPQPQTAAITVMLIAATGMVSESLQKGVLRVIGTIVGAVIGLSLIAVFPQDRMLYLFSVSIAVSVLLYLYNAYQGDSTLFMLAAVVTLMVFNGGNAEGAFLYGVDRTLLTAFGVLVYTLVASLLWPVRQETNTKALASAVSAAHSQAFSQLRNSQVAPADAVENLLKQNEAFQSHFVTVRNGEEKILNYAAEWDTIASNFEHIDELLVPALQSGALEERQYQKYILNYDEVMANIETLFEEIQSNWNAGEEPPQLEIVELHYNTQDLQQESHLSVAAVVSRADLLLKLQGVLLNLWQATNSLQFNKRGFRAVETYSGKPSFIWLDLENFKTAVRVFISFWIAAGVWIAFNPPGGFTFVTLSAALVVLVSYTPVPPKLLYILFTIGFLFSVPAYIFLLPNLTHWAELAVFLFAYAFIGFYVFAGPLSIFFLLGLMTLGIQNTMNYNFDVILIMILLFYMICTSLVITVYFPFTSKPQLLYVSFRKRFFNNCGKVIARSSRGENFGKHHLMGIHLLFATSLNAKMRQWSTMIKPSAAPANTPEQYNVVNTSCALLVEQLKILVRQNKNFTRNPLIDRAKTSAKGAILAQLCDALANTKQLGKTPVDFDTASSQFDYIEASLDEFLGENYLESHSRSELTEFYLFLNLQASILASIVQCRSALEKLDWEQLQGNTF